MKQQTDPQLARACRNGEAEAWRELIRRFTPLVYRVAHRIVLNKQEAEDVSQEAFMDIHRSFHTFDATRPMAPWISRIAYNASLKRLRGRHRNPVDGGSLDHRAEPTADSQTGGTDNPEHLAARSEAKVLLRTALARIAAQDRVLLDLHYREGMTVAEIGEATGMPANTVKTRVVRARGYLRQILLPLMKELP